MLDNGDKTCYYRSMRTTEKLRDELLDQLYEVECLMEKSGYNPTEKDIRIKGGVTTYKKTYLDKMPSEYSTLLGRHSALLDTIQMVDNIEEEQDLSLIKSLSKDITNDKELNPRFQLKFDIEHGEL